MPATTTIPREQTPSTEQTDAASTVPSTADRPGFVQQCRDYVTPREHRLTEGERRALEAGDAAQLRWELRVDRSIKARRLPYLLSGATAATGILAWGVAESGVHPLIVAPVASAAVLATTAVIKLATRKVISEKWRRHVWMAGTVSALWVAISAIMPHPGLVLVMVGTLFVLQHVLSRKWRADHPLPMGATIDVITHAVTTPESDNDAIDDEVIKHYATAWENNIATPRGALPESWLTDGTSTEYAVRYTLQLVPGRQTIETVKSKIHEIASGLGPDSDDFIVERYPRKPGELKDSSKVKLTIVLKSPVEEPRFFAGPRLSMDPAGTRCSAVVGRYADGLGEAEWPLWNSGGMRNGLLIGSTRSGKSGVSVGLTVSARASGRINTIYVDPQAGMSSPGIAQRARIGIYGREAARRAIDVVEAIARDREDRGGINTKATSRKQMFADATSKFMPSTQQPGWLVIVDECDKIFSDPTQAALWSEFVSRCLKLGMSVLAITQYPGLTSFTLESLRSNLAQNYIALRTNGKTSGHLVPGLTKDPAELPDGMPGYGLFGGGERSDVPFRGDWLPEDDDADKLDDEPPWRLDAAMEAHTEPAPCPRDQAVVEALLGPADEDGYWTVVGDESFLDNEDGAPSPTQAAAERDSKLPDLKLPPIPEPLKTVPVEMEASDKAVLEVVTAGHFQPKWIVQRTGLSRAQVNRCLTKLGAHHLIHNPKKGIWKPAPGENQPQDQAG